MCASILNTSIAECASSFLKFVQSDNDSGRQRTPMREWFHNILSKIRISDVCKSFEFTLREQISMFQHIKCLPKKCDYIIDMYKIS